MTQRETLLRIAMQAIRENVPDAAVRRAVAALPPCSGKTILVAIGKAAWEMADAAARTLEGQFDAGFLITKYGHIRARLPRVQMFEAGHPVLDQNGIDATRAVLAGVSGLSRDDRVLLLVSGGGSALFESPRIPLPELQAISARLLACGADITEINTIRKWLSAVKGGRFAAACAPASVEALLLSDVVGDRPDVIASGPACPDRSTAAEALAIAEKYALPLSAQARELLLEEPPRSLPNAHCTVIGGVGQLCRAAADACAEFGYAPEILTCAMTCEAREAGSLLGSIAAYQAGHGKRRALIAGGETVVHLRGDGLGGRSQELALAAAAQLDGVSGAALLAIGSDGTDGPTDAAGGLVDGGTAEALRQAGISLTAALDRNDAYHALDAAGALIRTGATGTNVNDVVIILVEGEKTR